MFDLPSTFHRRSYIPGLPGASLERCERYISQSSMKHEPRSTGGRLLVARPSETGRPLVVARPLVEEVKRGKEDELGILDGGQVELEHVLSTKDPWVKEEQTNDSGSGETPAFSSSRFHTQSVFFFETRDKKSQERCVHCFNGTDVRVKSSCCLDLFLPSPLYSPLPSRSGRFDRPRPIHPKRISLNTSD